MTTETEHTTELHELIATLSSQKAEQFEGVARTLDAQARTTLATHYYNLADAYEALAAARRREAALQADRAGSADVA